ncbi:related to EDC3 Enhancer of mRNA DeCapping [Rhynchosporium secalis]|uniref:Enhancer of mRNA-decapping protein 3 n=1 Tax=Rhynchosporium secalis TaxID=38038 RepID=A0A1E1LV02_RHYSE|nr:related to EDC3 Enhancer of mRNA DeCapping [Rhynchosporium secalis]
MSNSFIGLTMLVTLKDPPGAQLRGVVKHIEPGVGLTLLNVVCPANGKYVPEFTIKVPDIVTLVEATSENAKPNHAPPRAIPVAPVVKSKPFEDPAILSMGKRPTPASKFRSPIPQQWSTTSMERTDSAQTATGRETRSVRDMTPAAVLVEPMETMRMEANKEKRGTNGTPTIEEEDGEAEVPADQPASRQRKQRRRKGGRKILEDVTADASVTPAKETTNSKGWRQTPLLEPTTSFQPFATLKKSRRRNGKTEENGWQTEDATDVQEMGDFDFQGSLAKFDKNTIFTQMQAEDSVADEDRLVSHNRLPKAKPGTAGGKNLHYTENVLDGPPSATAKTTTWKNETSDSEDAEGMGSQRGSGSGRRSRRTDRAESKLSMNHRSVSRKGSAGIHPARTLSVRFQDHANTPHANGPKIPIPASKPSFFLVPSDRRCEPISALQMLNLENIADNELGLSEDMMTENAGRGIAEVALSALNTGGGRGLIQGKNSTVPTVVVLAGNNKSGLRAVAAGRHIRNHGLNVVVCVLGLERESELLVGLRRQIKVFRGFGGRIVTKIELLEYVKALGSPLELIIDGLLGLTISFEELRTGDQATAYELIAWANRNKARVLAIDVPTGIDPTTGKVSIIDGRQLYIHAEYVVAMGTPKKGLLEAMALGEGVADEDSKAQDWQLFVADIGLGAAVWKKAGTRVRRGVEFDGSWVLPMRFGGGE